MSAAPLLDAGFEQRMIDTAKRLLDHIPPCRDADYKIRWLDDFGVRRCVPFLVVAFTLPETRHQPACGVRLMSVSRSTGANTILEGERLKNHIERSVEHYLNKHGIRIPFVDPT